MAEGVSPIARTHSTGDRFTRSAVCTSSPPRSLRPRWTAFLSILRANRQSSRKSHSPSPTGGENSFFVAC